MNRQKPRNRLVNREKRLVVASGQEVGKCVEQVKEVKRYNLSTIQ